ncbi:transcriptional regulator [Streptomyces antimycoticus]|uniref:transcriptional regulator n=1 Tax=Streptomyces antimycoticus TaxID=68175 RepID=UPI003807AE57
MGVARQVSTGSRAQTGSGAGPGSGSKRDPRLLPVLGVAFLEDRLAMSDSALSKQLATREEAGYVATARRLSGSRRKVRARLAPTGRDAFNGHVAALREIVDDAANPADGPATRS